MFHFVVVGARIAEKPPLQFRGVLSPSPRAKGGQPDLRRPCSGSSPGKSHCAKDTYITYRIRQSSRAAILSFLLSFAARKFRFRVAFGRRHSQALPAAPCRCQRPPGPSLAIAACRLSVPSTFDMKFEGCHEKRRSEEPDAPRHRSQSARSPRQASLARGLLSVAMICSSVHRSVLSFEAVRSPPKGVRTRLGGMEDCLARCLKGVCPGS